MNEDLTNWLVCSAHNTTAHTRLFCFPCAGGAASMYRSWTAEFREGIEVWAIQPPGREERGPEQHLRSWTEVVSQAADAISNVQDERPFYLFGHSFGGLVAFEVVRELRQRGVRLPLGLLVSGRSAPSLGATYLLNHLGDTDLLSELLRLAPENQAALKDPDTYEAILPQLRADLAICDSYVYKPEAPLQIPIVAFGGRSDPVGTPERITPWELETSVSFSCHWFDGHHFFIKSSRSQFLRILGEEIQRIGSDPQDSTCRTGLA